MAGCGVGWGGGEDLNCLEQGINEREKRWGGGGGEKEGEKR